VAQIPGVKIVLWVNGEQVQPEYDGCVGRLEPIDTAILEAKIRNGSNGFGLAVDGNKNVALKKDWLPFENPEGSGRLYQQKVTIKLSLEQKPHTEYVSNHLRVLKLYADGRTELWEIALISQDGNFFLTTQRTYAVRCYYQNGDEGVVCPYFQKWPQLVTILKQLFTEEVGIRNMTRGIQYQPEPQPSPNGLASNTARVLWWNAAQGFGMVVTPEGPARLHWSQVTPHDRIVLLEPDELVKYVAIRTPVHKKSPKGSNAKERKTSFQREVVGVKQFANLRR
jgi:hypothetical protein